MDCLVQKIRKREELLTHPGAYARPSSVSNADFYREITDSAKIANLLIYGMRSSELPTHLTLTHKPSPGFIVINARLLPNTCTELTMIVCKPSIVIEQATSSYSF